MRLPCSVSQSAAGPDTIATAPIWFMQERVAKAFDRAAEYLLGRQCADGGFCFYRCEYLEEPNLADTYHAVAALSLLGRALPHAADATAFVERFPPSAQPSHLYYITETRRLVDSGFQPNERLACAIRRLRLTEPPSPSHLSDWLQRTRLVARLKGDFADRLDIEVVRRMLERVVEHGGFGSRPNLCDTWLALEILDACGRVQALPAMTGFVERLQGKPFGFTNTLVGTTANVDTIFAGVRSCALLGIPVRYPEWATSFTLLCQTGGGGFARAPNALPNIEYTFKALAALTSLVHLAGSECFQILLR